MTRGWAKRGKFLYLPHGGSQAARLLHSCLASSRRLILVPPLPICALPRGCCCNALLKPIRLGGTLVVLCKHTVGVGGVLQMMRRAL